MITDGDAAPELEGGMEIDHPVEEPVWVVARSLLEVNDACSSSLELLLLYAGTDRIEELPTNELENRIDDAIAKQRQVVEELMVAKEALSDVE